MTDEYTGSDFDDFLKEEDIFGEVEAAALKKVLACMLEQAMVKMRISKSEMARRMNTSRTQLERLLDPEYPSVTLATITKAAQAAGKKIFVSFEEAHS